MLPILDLSTDYLTIILNLKNVCFYTHAIVEREIFPGKKNLNEINVPRLIQLKWIKVDFHLTSLGQTRKYFSQNIINLTILTMVGDRVEFF